MQNYLKRTLAIVLMLSMLFSMTAFAEQGTVSGSDVNVRSGPDTSYPVIDCLPRNTEVTVTDRSNSSWYKISYNGKTGYMYSMYLKLLDNASGSITIDGFGSGSASGTPGVVNGQYVRFRSGPSKDAAILGTYNNGTQLTVTGPAVDGWRPVILGGQSGYVFDQYVTVNESAPSVAPDPPSDSGSIIAPDPTPTPVPGSAVSQKTGYISGDSVNFRSGPGSNYPTRGAYDKGKELIITGEQNGWTAVLIDGIPGYVYSQYISVTNPAGSSDSPEIIIVPGNSSGSGTGTSESSGTSGSSGQPPVVNGPNAIITGDYVNFRSGPGSSYSILGCYNNGTEVLLKGENNGWSSVEINGRDGYVFSQYIKKNSPVIDPQPNSGTTPGITPEVEATPVPTATPAPSVTAYITGFDVNFRSGPSSSFSIIGSFSKGTVVEKIGEVNGWSQIIYNGSTGYVFSQYVSETNPNQPSISPDTPIVTAPPSPGDSALEGFICGNSVRFRSQPSTDSAILGTYNYGQTLTITDDSGEWYACTLNGVNGYVYGTYVAKGSTVTPSENGTGGSIGNATGQDIVNYALTFVGCNYVWGGTSPAGFDCSGLVQYVYAHFGYRLKRVAADQATEGILVTGELQPGDLLCFYSGSSYIGHIGIYIGDGQFVHASNSTTGVIISQLNGYYVSRGYVARRIIY